MNTSDPIATEYFTEKLQVIQDNYAELMRAYADLAHEYEQVLERYLKLSQDYECCALDLNATRQQLYDATEGRY